MKQLLIIFLLLFFYIPVQGQFVSQLKITNIKNSFSQDLLYLPFRYKGNATMYLNGVDQNARILFNYKLDISPLEVRPSPDGNSLIIAGGIQSQSALYRLDTLFNISPIDSLVLDNNPKGLDPHDFQFLPNGNLLMFSPSPETTDLSSIVEGGQTAATIIHFDIYEIDIHKQEVVHSWHSKDNLSIFDAGNHIDLQTKSIDYCHFNSVQYLELDQTIITSSRDMSEITKIKWPEGDIIWRMGGKKNEFEFINDTIRFTGQHQARFHGDTLLLFDNGTFHPHQQSSVVMYKVDEIKKTATLLKRFYGNDFNFTKRRGGVIRLNNGNYLVSWGQNTNIDHNFSELSPFGETLQKGYFYNIQNYRVNKGKWQPKLISVQLVPNTASNHFQIALINQSKYPLNISQFTSNQGTYPLDTPLTLQPGAKHLLPININGDSKDVHQINGNIEYQYKDLFFVNQAFHLVMD